MTDTTAVDANPDLSADALVGRLFDAANGAFDLLSIVLGDRLGLYHSLSASGPATSTELAARTGIAERYAREWLEQQAATGILVVDDVAADPRARSFSLPDGHAQVLVDPESPYSMVPAARSVGAVAGALPRLIDAYRSGSGVEWSDFGVDMIEAQGDFNRPWLLASLASSYLPAIPDVHARLQADPPARVADVACGVGWASIAIAKGYPKVHVDGYDLDEHSIRLAQANAEGAGVADRVTFQVRDAGDPAAAGRYDLVVMIEALHDVSRPVEVLSAMRRMLAPEATVILADERTNEAFSAPASDLERLLYGFSAMCCLPAAMGDPESSGTGAVMRPGTLRGYATSAGFRDVDVLDLEHDQFRFYRLTP
jgi:2-polyprenyl-3-methyl-5-hydroxy-6-metoxy-1,4-benzoquinol methylase